jgi:hypothetical protein
MNRLELFENAVKMLGKIFKDEHYDVSLFGDSPIMEESYPDTDMVEDENQLRSIFGGDIPQAIPVEQNYNDIFIDVNKKDHYSDEYKLTHFIDGSLRTKYIGELIDKSGKGGPIVLGNIGAVVTTVDYNTFNVKLNNLKTKLIFFIPKILPDTSLWNIQSNFQSLENNFKIDLETISLQESKGDLKYHAQSKTRRRMHEIEVEIAKEINDRDKKWVVIDGALRISEFWNLNNTIGVAKSFGTKIEFLDMGGLKTISFLSKMRKGKRSLVFRYKLGKNSKTDETEEKINFEKIAFWYLRIRESPPEMAPLGGIVKVDIKYDEKQEEFITEIANKLSYSILRISDPSIYPLPRWPSFLYPIRICEQYLREILLNQDEFLRLGISIKKIMKEV